MTEEAKKLYDRKGQVVRKMEEISKPIKEGTQDKLTTEQRTTLRTLAQELRDLDEQITDQGLLEEAGLAKAMVGARRISGDAGERTQEEKNEEKRNLNFDFQIYKKAEVKHGPITEWQLRNFDINEKMQRANVYQVLAAMHPMADAKTFSPATKYALDQVFENRAATTTALVTEFLAAQLIDGGLSKSRLAEAGMQVQVLEEKTKRFAKITGYPTFEWVAEQAQTSDKTVTFSSVDFESKTLRGFVTISGEQAQDCHNLDMALRTVFQRSIGNSIDTAGLYGEGTATEPEGIKNYSNVNTYDLNDAISSYDPWVHAAKLILDDNGDIPTHSIIGPNVWRDLNLLRGTNEQANVPPPWDMANHKFLVTSKIAEDEGTPANRQTIFLGGFRTVNLGVRLSTRVIISPVESDKFQWNYFVVTRGDIKPYREEDLAIITNVSSPDTLT